MWQRLSRNESAKLCVSSFVEPAVLLLKSPACILPHDLAPFNSPLLIIVIRSCSRCIGRGVVLAFDSSSDPLLSPAPVISTTSNKSIRHTPEIRLLSSNHTSTLYRAFRTIPTCEVCPPPTYDWLDTSPSKLQLSCSCSRLGQHELSCQIAAPLSAYYNRFLFPAAPASFRLSLNQ